MTYWGPDSGSFKIMIYLYYCFLNLLCFTSAIYYDVLGVQHSKDQQNLNACICLTTHDTSIQCFAIQFYDNRTLSYL